MAPLFLLYDYSFRRAGRDDQGGVPGATRTRPASSAPTSSCCTPTRIPAGRPGAGPGWRRPSGGWPAIDPALPTVLVNHFPLVREPTRVLRYPEFAQWCGTEPDRRLAPPLPGRGRSSTATCTSRAPPGTTASASRRSRSAIRASGTVGTPARRPPGARVRRWVAPTRAAALRDVADRGPSFHRDQAKEDLHLPRASGPRKSVRVRSRVPTRGTSRVVTSVNPVQRRCPSLQLSARCGQLGGHLLAGGGGNLQLLHCDAGMATFNQGNQTVRGNQYTRSPPPGDALHPPQRAPRTALATNRSSRHAEPGQGRRSQLVPNNDQGPVSDVSETGPRPATVSSRDDRI